MAHAGSEGTVYVGANEIAEVVLNLYPEGLDNADDEFLFGTATVVGVTRNAAEDGVVEASFEALGVKFHEFMGGGSY